MEMNQHARSKQRPMLGTVLARYALQWDGDGGTIAMPMRSHMSHHGVMEKVSLKSKRAHMYSTWPRAGALRTLNENASRYPYLHLPQSANTRQCSNRESFWGENRFQTQAAEGPERRRQRRKEAFQKCAKDSAGLGGGRVQHEVQPGFFENRPKNGEVQPAGLQNPL